MQERAFYSKRQDFEVPQRFRNPVSDLPVRVSAAISNIDSVLQGDACVTRFGDRKTNVPTKDQLRDVDRLQQIWNRRLGLKADEPGELKNYNPVLARWNFERLQTDEQREQFRSNELMNITTALRERNQTQESRLQLLVDDNGKIRNEAFPEEPYEAMLERGLEYRAKNGSNDLDREKAEVDGFRKIQKVLTDPETPLGSIYMVISPPSEVKDSPYGHNFVDGYQVVQDEASGERRINYVRYASPLDTEAYAEIAEKMQPGFLDSKTQREQETGKEIPLDAWYLENPFFVSAKKDQDIDTIFDTYFAKDVEAMEESEWQKLDRIYLPYKLYLLDQLTKDDFDPEAIARAYNLMLLSQERKSLQMDEKVTVLFDSKEHTQKLNRAAYQYVARMAKQHGHEQAEEKKVGCGGSSSVSIKNGQEFMKNSVADFGKKEKNKNACSDCGRDGSDNHYHCPGCSKDYADETAKTPEQRTQSCKCGFKFGC